MATGTVCVDIEAPCDLVFDVLHDYSRRLRWDTMLSDARLLGDATAAAKGVRSRCVGTWRTAFVPMETEYVTFSRGEVAAVRLTNRPFFFETFAASIRHTALGKGASRVTYTYSFRVRPHVLAPLLTPIVGRLMASETRARLLALRDFVLRDLATGGTTLTKGDSDA
jgi:polyketide cyclase/dehydrase/lipid transport protein